MENDNMPQMAVCGRGRQPYCTVALLHAHVGVCSASVGGGVNLLYMHTVCLHMYASSGICEVIQTLELNV